MGGSPEAARGGRRRGLDGRGASIRGELPLFSRGRARHPQRADSGSVALGGFLSQRQGGRGALQPAALGLGDRRPRLGGRLERGGFRALRFRTVAGSSLSGVQKSFGGAGAGGVGSGP